MQPEKVKIEALISWISDYFFFATPAHQNNAPLIVMGTNLPSRPAEHAIGLYQRNPQTMVLSGGWNSRLQNTEAQAMFQHLRQAGIPERQLLLETHARHTRDNLRLSLDLLKEFKRLSDCIHIVAISYHGKRTLLLAQEIAPQINWGIQAYSSQHFINQSWHTNPQACQLILSELTKIAQYVPHATQTWPASPEILIMLWQRHTQSLQCD